jgi:hypothetical protein
MSSDDDILRAIRQKMDDDLLTPNAVARMCPEHSSSTIRGWLAGRNRINTQIATLVARRIGLRKCEFGQHLR